MTIMDHCWHLAGCGVLKDSEGRYLEGANLAEARDVCCWCGAKRTQIKTSHGGIPGQHGPHVNWHRETIVVHETISKAECERG